ncbi:MAG: UDP-N-acetylmuramate dehydrogenase [Candidatus Dojkabacteria bacterium]
MKQNDNYNIKEFNTFGISVKAKKFIIVENDSELKELFDNNEFKTEIFILGGGSNVVFTQDFEGTIIKLDTKGVKVNNEDENNIWVEAESGEDWDAFVAKTMELKAYGLENLSLIPGDVGASAVQNIGAYGVEAKDFIDSVEYFDITSGNVKKLSIDDLEFAYRDSVFKHKLKGKAIVIKIVFKLNKKPSLKLEYADIQKIMAENGLNVSNLTPEKLRQIIIDIRTTKLEDPKLLGNAGSFFKNPIIEESVAVELQKTYPDLKFNLIDKTFVKLSAGWLIEQAGWKGWTSKDGKYGVSKKHALVLVNYLDATGENIVELAEKIKSSVKEKFGILLEEEAILI